MPAVSRALAGARPVLVYDLDSLRFVDVNAAAVERYGYSVEEFRAMRVTDLVPPGDAVPIETLRGLRDEREGTAPARHLTKAGDVIEVELACCPVELDGRSLVLAVAHDDPARDALRALERRYRELVENANDIIYVHDLEGNILSVNRAGERLLGYTREEVPSLSIDRIVIPEHREAVRRFFSRAAAGGIAGPQTAAIEVFAKDGRRVALEVGITVVEQDGQTVIQGIARDVTDRHASRERERAERTRAHTLADIAGALAEAALDEDAVLDIVVRRTSESLRGVCAVRLLSSDGSALLPAAAHVTGRPLLERPVTVHDAASVLSSGRAVALAEDGSVVAAPLRARGRVLGLLTVSRDEAPFDASEESFIQDVADRAALAIANARLFEETQERLGQLRSLHSVELAITGDLDLGQTLHVVVDQVVERVEVGAAAIAMFDDDAPVLRYVAARGFTGHAVHTVRIPAGQGLVGRAAASRRTVVAPDALTGEDRLAASERFVASAAIPLIAKGRVRGVLQVWDRSPFGASPAWLGYLEALAAQAAIAIHNAELFEDQQRLNGELVRAYEATLEGWSRALDLRDSETEFHSRRVAGLTVALGETLGISDADLANMRRGALLHDIGKMGVPDTVLHKPGELSPDDWAAMRRHPQYALELLSPIPYLRSAVEIPYSHHERWDGSGYPRGLRGEEIPAAARIFAVVDVWDALRADRPYRKAWPEEKALAYLRDAAGTLFDPAVVEAFLDAAPWRG